MAPNTTPSLVSILLPVYNGEKFLAAAIESVLEQSYESFELLIADDQSGDSSAEIIEKYSNKDRRVKSWRNEKNLGLFQNYNACLEAASGEFVKPFAQDDILEPNQLDRFISVLNENPSVGLISCAKRWIDPADEELKRLHVFPEDRLIKGQDVIICNLIALTNWVGEPSTVMFRSALKDDGFDTDFFHYGDLEYWFRIIRETDYFYLNEVLCSFRRHPDSGTTKNLNGMLFALDLLNLGKKYRKELAELGESEDHYHKRVVEVIALNMNHLVEKQGLNAGEVATTGSVRPRTQEELERELAAFKELSFHAMRYVTAAVAELDHLKRTREDELELWQKEIHKLLESPSWKVTAPLRAVKDIIYNR